jgi:hypothetical protein
VDFLYSLYDALVSINVPSDKARAVVDAMERDMGTTLATKQDLEVLRRDVENRFSLLEQKFDSGMSHLELRMTVKLGSMLMLASGLVIAALRLWA